MSGINLALLGATFAGPVPNLYDTTTFSGMITTLTSNLASFKNASFYEYNLDGNSTYINDGGGDMYDAGNYTQLYENGSSLAGNLDYTVTNSTAGNLRYGSLGYARPLTLVAVTNQNTSRRFGFGKSGNNGADGGGTVDAITIYSNASVNGFIVNAWMKRVGNAGDPSINDLYATIGHTNWNSTFTSTDVTSYSTNTDNGQSQYETTSTNSLVMATLLSKSGGTMVTQAEAQTVLQNFTSVLKTHFGY